jgi:hypothetical protein
LRPVLARLPRWVSDEPPRERTHPRNLNAALALAACPSLHKLPRCSVSTT